MSDPTNGDTKARISEVTSVFKSAEVAPQRLNHATNSAVSETSVDRNLVSPGQDAHDLSHGAPLRGSIIESTAESIPQQIVAISDQLQTSMVKADAAVRSIEERQASLESSFQKAEAMLAEVSRVNASLTLNDELRKRIQETIKRTRALRGSLK